MLGLDKILGGIFGVIDKVVPDKDLAQKIKFDVQSQAHSGEMKELDAAMKIIVAEAQGGAWLQRSWRPVTMLTFTGLIVAKWLGVTAPGITEQIELELFAIIKIGLGGYVFGRSAEKVATAWKAK
ncbi:3TM-type holin [Paremcibacter congregatus]|uniref:3TM-type holin n=1 Tax=Paremcibacter congregatus TaxID=2043170 RepID=UPI001120DDFD|nr:3TM-type holin [Paremcibacter congregatus]QDE27280.1 hypothetical protein FIV45_08270 [Paremcibacter congregatus]